MTVGIMVAISLHGSCSSLLQVSTPSTSRLDSVSQVSSLRVQSSLGWVSRRRCALLGFPVASWTPAVGGVRVASRDETSVLDEEDGDDGLSYYENELGLEEEEEEEEDDDDDEVEDGDVVGAVRNEQERNVASGGEKVRRTFRQLGNKEKKELRAYAHQLGNDICIHQVGKWGLTANCITAISDALEANELIKIRVLDNLDEELADTASKLESKTGAQIVGKMGRTLLLYRPSMRKLKAAQLAQEKAFKYQKRKTMLASRSKSSKSFPGASRGKR
ncbi:uncharacterized protein [Physcomitrium patens]|uniref:CRM domain-containing protein n=1 Tax=Physcomitrium patens TaxID=3218 RepID=A9S9R6_PHYPA|nr:uncharacterized protein LOC112279663 [Physcomitrium patens]PNR62571.1 hypothetical protein PHYPA_000995 [Physcomitrium patens]|eukprot:XP_024370076.1 uncharacterized protein LOC112279663 [Physcomitrella patens]